MRSPYRTVGRDAVLIALPVGFLGLAFGAAAVAAGWSPLAACAASALVFAGGSQFLLLAAVATGAGPVAAALGGLALNARYLPLGMAVARKLDAGRPPLRRALAAHLLVDESAAMALGAGERQAAPAFWATGAAIFAAWNAGTATGALLGNGLGDLRALGLDAVMPAAMLALLAPLVATRPARAAAIAGAAVAVALAPVAPPGLPVLIAGLGAAGAVAAWRGRP